MERDWKAPAKRPHHRAACKITLGINLCVRHLAEYVADRSKHLHPAHELERCAVIEAALNTVRGVPKRSTVSARIGSARGSPLLTLPMKGLPLGWNYQCSPQLA